ncbi:MAG: glutamate-1-semialdehyde 2,1-aminomutase [Thermaerobacter sp.]|nr:glutamate-1-semialdehyde-2,1-aminomutase [Bacillota bacterium]
MSETGSRPQSARWFERARRAMPGGVNSPVRAFGAVGGVPPFIRRGRGPRIEDEDGNTYIDYVLSWGPLILGHAPEVVTAALAEAAAEGTSFGAPTRWEALLAEELCDAVPGLEMVRLVNSGTEAAMSALRLARAYTGRSRIVKFAGCYHGHADSLLVEAGSGVATLGIPGTPGVTAGAAADTISLPYNDIDAVEQAFAAYGDTIAAVIVEPVAGNMGCVPPVPGFLEALRRLTAQHGALLIFDEVITGFRLHRGGAQAVCGIVPDLTCLGKVIGGGLPLAAYGGRREIMAMVAPEGPVYQAGTLSGNPLAVRAGLAVVQALRDEGIFRRLDETAAALTAGIGEALSAAGVPHCIQRSGSMFTVFFTEGPVRSLDDARRSDAGRFARFFHALLQRGVYIPPSPYECWFVSAAHGPAEVEATLAAVRDAAAGGL